MKTAEHVVLSEIGIQFIARNLVRYVNQCDGNDNNNYSSEYQYPAEHENEL